MKIVRNYKATTPQQRENLANLGFRQLPVIGGLVGRLGTFCEENNQSIIFTEGGEVWQCDNLVQIRKDKELKRRLIAIYNKFCPNGQSCSVTSPNVEIINLPPDLIA